MIETTQYANITLYYDDDSDPENPGYVVSYDEQAWSHRYHKWETVQVGLTAALDAETTDEAISEAADLLSVNTGEIVVE
jgi:hypothetical protein